MSIDENKTNAAFLETVDQEHQSVVSRVANLPLVSSTYDKVSTTYTATKEDHSLIKSVCGVAEMGAKTIATAAVDGVQPILTTLEPQIAAVNEYACKGLNKLEEKLPILQQPADKVISNTKELVSSTVTGTKDAVVSAVTEAKDVVTGMMGKTKETVQGSMDATRSVMTSSMSAVMESSVGQKVVSSIDTLLGKSEELVDFYLPITDEELVKLATSLEGFEVASVEQQRQPKSYYVRLGSLSTKLRQRAYQHSLGKVKQVGQSTKEALFQLQQTIDLIDYAKEAVGLKLHDGQEKLNQMWQEWSRREIGANEDKDSAKPELIESQTLAVSRSIIHHLQAICLTLVSSIQGLPANMQDRVQQILSGLEDLHASFSTAASFQDLSSSVLSQSREKVTKAQESLNELLEYVVHNIPLTWIVGPFAPSGDSAVDDKVEKD
ncbi:perilipin-3-like [Terrapene carolina triunguis]|uniref:perilipin-3-like n=1 Tax=Terrapene triunguis TaxID=2587831 RepID=UPI000CEF86BB|nr:perilipin-3-like [Terrapene carolina triunguis]